MNKDPRTIINLECDPSYLRTLDKPKRQPKISIGLNQFHWTTDKFDARDYKYQVSNKPSTGVVDLRNFCTPIEDQGSIGSCTAQATASAIELLNNRDKKYKDISRLFIYYYNRLAINRVNVDSGAYIRDSIKTVSKQGAPLESLWPYMVQRFKIKPNAIAINDALKRRVTLYERITSHEGCIDALNNGFPVIIGFYVYSSFISRDVSKTGYMPYPDKNKESLLGGHAVLLVGYNNKQGIYIVRNSWGSRWGDKGYFYMPYKVIQDNSMSADFWVIKQVSNP